MLGHPGVGGVSLVAACRGTVGILAVVGHWRSPGTACAWGRSVYLRGCPSIRGNPLGPSTVICVPRVFVHVVVGLAGWWCRQQER